MGSRVNTVSDKISSFRRKYYLNLFLRGSILSLTLLLAYFLLASLIEYNLWLGKGARFTLFLLFFGTVAFCLLRYLRDPLTWWLSGRGIDKEQSARIIGRHFPAIQDRLVNFLQLAAVGKSGGDLVEASLDQKASLFENFSFESIVDFRENSVYLKYLAIPFLLFAFLFVFHQNVITQSTERLIKFNQEFSPAAPFLFVVKNQRLISFPNEDFELHIRLEGLAIPDAAYLVIGDRRVKMDALRDGAFTYTFEKLQQDVSFRVEAAGFYSVPHVLQIVNRPELLNLKTQLVFPRYIGRPAQVLSNAGNLEIPEGTRVRWNLTAADAHSATIQFASGKGTESMQQVDNQQFEYGRSFFDPDEYSITLENENSKNKDRIAYQIDVVKDQYPALVVNHLRDSILFKSIMVAGSIQDDYGLSRLVIHYQLTRKDRDERSGTIPLDIAAGQPQQNFFYNWMLDSLRLIAGDRLHYYMEVWDNDGVHGPKATRSSAYQFELPDDQAFKADIKKSQSATENQLERSLSKAKSLQQAIEEAEQRLKGKQSLDWQDKKMLEDLIQQKNSLDKLVEQLKEQNKLLEQKKDAYAEQNERIREKSEQIQKLMNELLDEETRKLFEELEKMLRENQDPSQIQKMLEKMERQEINLEKELERTLELFKGLQYEYKLDQAIREISDQAEKQKDLLEKTQELSGEKKSDKDQGQKKDPANSDSKDTEGKKDKEGESEKETPTEEQLAKEQGELKEQAEQFEKTVEELSKLGEELDKPDNTPSSEDMDQLQDLQQQSKESLEQKNSKKATGPQKKSVEKMQKMKEQLQGMQNSMSMEIDQQNLESLRQIIHGLIKLSFDQEAIIRDFNAVQQSDPAYVTLSQNQLKIKDDSKVLEDSLLALAKKDPFMGSIVTREIGELNDHLGKANQNIKERKKSNASADMQLSMTSINNLALMLNDHFEMMMDMMANAMPSMSKGKKQKGKKSLGEMQQKLNQQMEEIKNSGKSGRQLSEELAKMAAEQERIRRALQEMQEKMKQEGGKSYGDDLPSKMEQTELDLVNKQLTEQTIRRQKEIVTRLLESEKSMREQELDEERKGETAKDYQKEIPKEFEEYLRLKEKEVELLKTVPPRLYPYYKKEVNEYFKRLGNKK
ncbi:MAG: DUF4175 family protein [Cytophagales bacterium]|nr:DUF4175 family protein [Cytophagales bacterium]